MHSVQTHILIGTVTIRFYRYAWTEKV